MKHRLESGSVAAEGHIVTARRSGYRVGQTFNGFDEPAFLGCDVDTLADSGSPGLDVGVDPVDSRLIGPEIQFDVGGQFMGLLKGEMIVDLEMEVHGEIASVVVDTDVVDGHLVPFRDGADTGGYGLPLAFPRVGMNYDVGFGKRSPDTVLDREGDPVSPLQGEVSIDIDAHVDEHPGSRSTDPDLIDADHAVDGGSGFGYGLSHTVRSRVEKNVDRPLPPI